MTTDQEATMSKKDYELIAQAIRCELETARGNFEDSAAAGIEDTAARIASELGNDNPRFDGLRFLRACGLSDERIGRQA
jgi:hypothetical protein